MNIQIQSVKFDADKKLLGFIENKVQKLDKLNDRITKVDVTLKLDKDYETGNKVAVILVGVPGSELVAERRAKSFEESVDLCIDALKQQIEKHKNKQ